MGYLTTRDAYKSSGDHINWLTQGAPMSETLCKILQTLYPEKEVKWVALLPVYLFAVKRVAKIRQTSEYKAERLLDHLCDKALLVDSWYNGVKQFVMPSSVVGFIEFALMRTRGDINQRYLSELYYQYMNVKEDFIKDLFYATETKLGRVFIQELVLTSGKMNHILDHEGATHIMEEAEYIDLDLCYCCHKMYHTGHPCEVDTPRDICLTFDNAAHSLAEHGDYVRLIFKEEALDALERSYNSSLTQIGENVCEYPTLIYSYCRCCYKALQVTRHFSPTQPVATTNYIPEISDEKYVSCGKCAKVYLVPAISMRENGDGCKEAVLGRDICLGYGVCARNCNIRAIGLKRRPEQITAPVNSTHRFVLQTIEKGALQNLALDDQTFVNHRATAALFSAILNLPPIKQTMVDKRFKSVYLDRLLSVQSKRRREKLT